MEWEFDHDQRRWVEKEVIQQRVEVRPVYYSSGPDEQDTAKGCTVYRINEHDLVTRRMTFFGKIKIYDDRQLRDRLLQTLNNPKSPAKTPAGALWLAETQLRLERGWSRFLEDQLRTFSLDRIRDEVEQALGRTNGE